MTDKEVKSGETTTLTCTAKKLTTSADFKWYKSNTEVTSGVTKNDLAGTTQTNELVVTSSEDDTYKCVVTSANNSNDDKVERTVQLKVYREFVV